MSPKAKTLARRLLRENRGTRSKPARSWRVIARDDYQNKINHATLNRFALSEGEWLPKDHHLLVVLGLKKERVAAHHVKSIFDMSTNELRDALINREPMPTISTAWKRFFKSQGWKNIRARAR